MSSNFDFLKGKVNFDAFGQACFEAEQSLVVSPAMAVISTRRALELTVKWMYAFDRDLKMPYKDNISTLIHEPTFHDIIDPKLFSLMKAIIKSGNQAVHSNRPVKRDVAILMLRNLYEVVAWVDYCYADKYTASEFDESLLVCGEEKRVPAVEIQQFIDKISAKDVALNAMIKANEALRNQLALSEKRASSKVNYEFKVDEISEAKTRQWYIDTELANAGWDKDQIVEEYPLSNMPRESKHGFVDYVLFGADGKPLAIVEAKRSSKSTNVGLQQAKIYADCLEAETGQRPLIFVTNGFEFILWDDAAGYPHRTVSGIFTSDEMQLAINRRNVRKSLVDVAIDDKITNRWYQKAAIRAVCDAIENKRREALLVMATGTGKTRTAISLVDVLTKADHVKNILFLADRTALVRQAKRNFSSLLPNLTLCNLLDNKDNPESARMIFSTYPTMINAIDRQKRADGKNLFTPAHFDLIIIDESHRSIYKKYQEIFDYFDAMLVGLTATPKDEVDKNTYNVFDLESGVPTYAYEYQTAIEDGYLNDYLAFTKTSKIMEEGIFYDDLSEEDKEQFDDAFEDDVLVEDHISSAAVNDWLFNKETIDGVIITLMEDGLKVAGGDQLGKTIIFAKNTKHAEAICDRFNKLYPEYGGHFARPIYNGISHVDTLIDEFSDKDKLPQIAISIDMLDTGIDIPEVLNLVFFKKVRSKSKFWQMIGRGTRLCKDLFGPGLDKEKFVIFDFCGNFDFFRENPNGFEAGITTTLSENLFNTKVEMIRALQDLKYQEDEFTTYRNQLLAEVQGQIAALDESSFRVKKRLKDVHRFKNADEWRVLDTKKVDDLKDNIAPIVINLSDDELAKRFDLTMLMIELAYLQKTSAKKQITKVHTTSEKLAKLGTIKQVVDRRDVIEKVQTGEFWQSASILEMEEVRESLRDLIKLIEKSSQAIYFTDFNDEFSELMVQENFYDSNDLKSYRQKVEHYLKEHKDKLAVYKLRHNKKLTATDMETLERVLWDEIGTKEDYAREYGDLPVGKMVRKLIGLDQSAANAIFSEFLSAEALNSEQINFVKLIVDYVVKNGFMERSELQHDPFRSHGDVFKLFPDLTKIQRILNLVDEIGKNAEEVG